MSRSTKDVGILNIFEAKREAAILRQLPADWVALVERSRLDPGAPLEKPAIERLKTLRAEDAPTWARLRQLLKALNVPVTELDRQTRLAEPGHKGGSAQVRRLLDMVERDCTLFHCGDEAFAEFEHDGHRQSWPVPSQGFSAWLRAQYFEASDGGAPNNEALQTAISTPEGKH